MRRLLAAPATLELVAAALDGTGPALLPTTEPRVLAALQPGAPLESDEVAVVVPTSGSTGEPKGVLLTAGNLRASAAATADRLGGPGQWLLALPTTHVAGLQVLVRSLLAGTTPVALEGPTAVASFEAATARLTGPRRYVSLVPTQLGRLVDSPALLEYDAVLLGGAAAPPALVHRARDAGVRVVTTYGMSETSGGCVYDGVPLEGVRVDIGDDGRIALAGPVLMDAYRGRPDLTGQVLRDGWFTTSDLGRFDTEGRLEVLGRADDVIITGGENVVAGVVADAVARHPQVAAAAVLGRSDAEWGERIVAVCELEPGARLELAELRRALADELPGHALPRELVIVGQLPRDGLGKVRRDAVADLLPGR